MLNNVPLSMLRAFEAAGRSESFRAAAAEPGLTASAVSHAIRKLEDMLGVRLFQRQAKAGPPSGNAIVAVASMICSGPSLGGQTPLP